VISCALSASTLEREIWITPFLFLEAVEKPNIVKPASFKEVKINKGIMKVKLPAKSIVTLELHQSD